MKTIVPVLFLFALSGCIPPYTMRLTGRVFNSDSILPVILYPVSLVITNVTNTVLTGLDGSYNFDMPYFSNVTLVFGNFTNIKIDMLPVRFKSETNVSVDLKGS